MTSKQLSDATANLGYRVPLSVIANLEHDRRDSVSISELLILAAALDVPPILLMAPIGRTEDIEALPSVHVSPWLLRGWIMGSRYPAYTSFDRDKWREATAVLGLFDAHRLLVQDYLQLMQRLNDLVMSSDSHAVVSPEGDDGGVMRSRRRRLISDLAFLYDQIRIHRQRMVDAGLALPELPDELIETRSPISAYSTDRVSDAMRSITMGNKEVG